MKTAIILHGMPSRKDYFDPKIDSQSNCHWLPWLQQQLNVNGILTQTPEMPAPYNPDYEKWKMVFEQFSIDEETILIGHSCGAGFVVKYLSDNNLKVGKVFLVAPWINPQREEDITMFDNLKIDANLLNKTSGITMFSSTDDGQSVKNSVEILKNTVKDIKVLEFENYGHFRLNDMRTREFPELLNAVLF